MRIDHRTKAISFGLDLHVAHKEEVPEGPYLQVWCAETFSITAGGMVVILSVKNQVILVLFMGGFIEHF